MNKSNYTGNGHANALQNAAENHNYQTGDLVVALDIGTTKICAVVGRKNEHGKIEILGVGKVKSTGVLRGVVANIDQTVKAISDAIDIAEKSADCHISRVHVGIAGQHIKSIQHRGNIVRPHPEQEISKSDIDQLVSDVYKLSLGAGVKILHVIPQEYTVDGEQGIIDPIGMSGNKIEANFHIITGEISAFNNIHRCVQKAGLEIVEMTLEPIASASAVLIDKEMEGGVALIDIGGGTTDLTIIQEGIIRHTAVVPFGGNIITTDIKKGCIVMKDQAEKLKIKFGSALAEEIVDNRIITIPGFKEKDSKEISEKNIAKIIQARMEEIFRFVVFEIKRSGYDKKLIGGIVITGGGSLLRHVDLLGEYYTGMNVRIGYPTENLASGYSKYLNTPILSTAVGLLYHAINKLESNVKPVTKKIEITNEVTQDQEIELELETAIVDTKPVEKLELEKAPKKMSLFDRLVRGAIDFIEAKPDSDF